MPKPKVRKGMPSVQLTKEEFSKRVRQRFYDPTFTAVAPEIEKVISVAWKNYTEYHKNPRKRPAGRGFSDPKFPLPIEWLETRKASNRRSAVKKITSPIRAFSSSTVPPGATKPVRGKCQKPFAWRRWPKELSQGTRVS